MPIDILEEELISLHEVPKFLVSRGGPLVTIRTVRQWAQDGKLETTRRGVLRGRQTSREAVARMLGEGQPKSRPKVSKPQQKQRTRKGRERSHEAAMEKLRKQGVA